MKTTRKILSALLVLAMVLCVAPFAFAATDGSNVVINEVYGGGGNSGAPYNNDFVELYNPTNADISLKGWSLQYASKKGTFSSDKYYAFADDAVIKAHDYFLIQLAGGTEVTDKPLPTPDAIGNISVAKGNGKIALVKSTEVISGATDANVVDFVGFGSANEYEGTGATAEPNDQNSVSRTDAKDTNDNSADFTKGEPTPMTSGHPTVDNAGNNDNSNGNETPVEKPDDNKDNSKTGDATALVAISAAMLLAATGVVAVVSNKKHF